MHYNISRRQFDFYTLDGIPRSPQAGSLHAVMFGFVGINSLASKTWGRINWLVPWVPDSLGICSQGFNKAEHHRWQKPWFDRTRPKTSLVLLLLVSSVIGSTLVLLSHLTLQIPKKSNTIDYLAKTQIYFNHGMQVLYKYTKNTFKGKQFICVLPFSFVLMFCTL